MAFLAVDKTKEEEKLRKKGAAFSFSICLYPFSRVVSGGDTKKGCLVEHYGGFEGKKKKKNKTKQTKNQTNKQKQNKNKKPLEKKATLFLFLYFLPNFAFLGACFQKRFN